MWNDEQWSFPSSFPKKTWMKMAYWKFIKENKHGNASPRRHPARLTRLLWVFLWGYQLVLYLSAVAAGMDLHLLDGAQHSLNPANNKVSVTTQRRAIARITLTADRRCHASICAAKVEWAWYWQNFYFISVFLLCFHSSSCTSIG